MGGKIQTTNLTVHPYTVLSHTLRQQRRKSLGLRPLQQGVHHPAAAIFSLIDQQLPFLRLERAFLIREIQRHRHGLHYIL